MTYVDNLAALAAAYGIADHYWDIRGQRHVTSDETKVRLLSLMGVPSGTNADVRESLHKQQSERWSRLTDPVVAARAGAAFTVPLRLPEEYLNGTCGWLLLDEEEREVRRGSGGFDDAHRVESAEVNGGSRVRLMYKLPLALEPGYYRIELEIRNGAEEAGALCGCSTLFIAPGNCYFPPLSARAEKMLGISAQLYSLRSEENWGIGDFSDLAQLTAWAGGAGLHFIGLNPLHAVAPRGEGGESPYFPLSRRAINPLYIDVGRAVGELSLPLTKAEIEVDGVRERLHQLRSSETVGYDDVARLKFALLEKLFAEFRTQQGQDSRWQDFTLFTEQRGKELADYAAFCALHEHFAAQGPELANWMNWPGAYQDPKSEEVIRFCEEHTDRVLFYQFVQWLADSQLQQVKSIARSANMTVGLYLDVALGVAGGGADSWANKDLYALGASIGAPGDAFSPQGQDWGLPPLIPHKLREAAYGPFIQMLRSAMRYSGALRIDHAMCLMRLYWVPGQGEARNGAYVSYNLDEMMAVLAIESQRNHCLVIGENLGTVPEELCQEMERRRVLAYKVIYFMKQYPEAAFKASAEYEPEALVVTSTHDLPTLRGWWEGADLAYRRETSMLDEESIRIMEEERESDRRALAEALVEEGLLPSQFTASRILQSREMPAELLEAVHLFLARTPCMLQAVQLEDLLLQREQANFPGSPAVRPNWRIKLSASVQDLSDDQRINDLIHALVIERSESGKGRRLEAGGELSRHMS